jgi:hypothetical protein
MLRDNFSERPDHAGSLAWRAFTLDISIRFIYLIVYLLMLAR